MESRKLAWLHFAILLLILLAGTFFRLAVVSRATGIAQSGYSSYMKCTLNFSSRYRTIRENEGSWRNGSELFDRLFVIHGKGADYSGLYRQLSISNHPPLYYLVLHTITALTSNRQASLGVGFAVNMVAFWCSVFLLYFLSSQILRSRVLRLFAVFLGSVGFLSMEAFVIHKGYALQTSLLLGILVLLFRHGERRTLRFYDYFLFGILCCLAFLTHYYSYLYIAGICAIITLQCTLIAWNPGKLFRYGIAVAGAVIAAVLLYPPAVRDMLGNYRSREIVIRVSSPGTFLPVKFWEELRLIRQELLSPPYLLLGVSALVLVAIAFYRRKEFRPADLVPSRPYLILALYAAACFLIIMYISPYNDLRYVSPLLPLYSILLAGLMESLNRKTQLKTVLLFTVVLVSYNVYGIAKVVQGRVPGSDLISAWRTERTLSDFSSEGSLMVISGQFTKKMGALKERMGIISFHVPPRHVSFCFGSIPEELFLREGDILALVDTNLPDREAREYDRILISQGFKMAETFRDFQVFRRNRDHQ